MHSYCTLAVVRLIDCMCGVQQMMFGYVSEPISIPLHADTELLLIICKIYICNCKYNTVKPAYSGQF